MALTTVTYYFDFVFSYVFDSHTSHHGSAHGILIRFWLEVMRSPRAETRDERQDRGRGDDGGHHGAAERCVLCCAW